MPKAKVAVGKIGVIKTDPQIGRTRPPARGGDVMIPQEVGRRPLRRITVVKK